MSEEFDMIAVSTELTADSETPLSAYVKLSEKKPGETLKLAVKRMLPGGPLAKKQLTKLKIYTTTTSCNNSTITMYNNSRRFGK